MTAKNFSLLAALIFAIVAVLQFARAVSGWPITLARRSQFRSGRVGLRAS
ncbi:MAG: hypothetical protein WA459_16365 [Stellaceae bacterium]